MTYTDGELRKNREAWIDALRSGDYNQSKRSLHIYKEGSTDHWHSCLGVACEISGVAKRTQHHKQGPYWEVAYDGKTLFLPKSVQQWLGLSDPLGGLHLPLRLFNGKGRIHAIAFAYKWTFEELADLIEQEPPDLFEKNLSRVKKKWQKKLTDLSKLGITPLS